jgi:hypothetical protein
MATYAIRLRNFLNDRYIISGKIAVPPGGGGFLNKTV